MKAEVQFNDFTGSIAADISDIIAAKKGITSVVLGSTLM